MICMKFVLNFFIQANSHFFEYDVNMNPYVNPVYEYFADKYTEFRRILRKTIINWIKINITEKKK